jgi:hypothetical protein
MEPLLSLSARMVDASPIHFIFTTGTAELRCDCVRVSLHPVENTIRYNSTSCLLITKGILNG